MQRLTITPDIVYPLLKVRFYLNSENPYISKYGGKSGQLAGETNEIERDPGKKDSSSQRITSFQHPNESINELEASKLKYSRSTPSNSSTSNSSRFVCLKIGRRIFDCRRESIIDFNLAYSFIL